MGSAERHDEKAKIWSMIKSIKAAMMVTHAGSDRLHGRPMVATSHEFDGALWFFTDKRSHKTEEIGENPRVLLAYSDWDSQTYVAIDGTAELHEDRAKIDELWQESMRAWFPKGKDDPNVALIRVEADGAAYWDAPSSTMVHAYGYMKARLTGERPHPGDTGRVTF